MRHITLLITLFVSTIAYSQYNSSNSIMRQAVVIYEKDVKGFFHSKENIMLNDVDDIEIVYAYNKKAQNLYVQTTYSNVVITLTKEYAKIIKKNKNIPQLEGEELDNALAKHNNILSERFYLINQRHQRELDSIRAKEFADSLAQVRADSVAKARKDSLERIRFEEIRKEQDRKIKAAETYRSTHNWFWLPIEQHYLICDYCDERTSDKDSILVMAISNDSLVYVSFKDEYLGEGYLIAHKTKIPEALWSKDAFKYHCEVYADSLKRNLDYNEDVIKYFNYKWYNKYVQKIESKAPYGFFLDWGWDDEYSMVTMHFKYMNTNKKTIKYIDVYWRITNDVKDVRGTGHFKGTGPLEYGNSAKWEWDSSHYFVAGDASNMDITKVILTFMDGTQKVLTGNSLKFD